MTENILDMVRKVASLRSHLANWGAEKKSILMAWETENHLLLDALAKATLLLAEAEAALRTEAIRVFQETGSKTPGPGLGIRLVSKLAYNPGEALAWATQHGLALKLDVPAFEKVAKITPLPFVTMSQEPSATIAQDLESILREIKEGGR